MTKRLLFLHALLMAASLLHAQFYAGSGSMWHVASGATLYVNGDVTLGSGSTTTLDGTLRFTGSFDNNGTTTASSGTVYFNGSSAQAFNGTGLTVGTLVAENSSGDITLNAALTVNTASTFTDGLIATSAANPLIYSNGANIGTPTDASHVNGPARYLGTGNFIFPIGNATYYRQVELNLSANATGVTANYTQLNGNFYPPGNATFNSPLVRLSKMEYWELSPVSTATGTVKLNWDASKVSPGIVSGGEAAIVVAHYNGSSWDSEGGSLTGNFTSGSVTSTNTISAWSPFALGSTSALNPLPLNFLGVSASLKPDGGRLVKWDVAQEVNVRDYTVQRSVNGNSFADAGIVTATGSPLRQTYSFTDIAPINERMVYYRVQANDLDGRKNYSNIVSVRLEGNSGLKLQPNPVNSFMLASFGKGMKGTYSMEIFSNSGALVHKAVLTVSDNEAITVNRPTNIVKGMYLVRFTRASDGIVESFKLLFE